MQIEYRIVQRNNDYFPHVRIKKYFFWGKWKKIAEHVSGFGMYSLPDTNHPKTLDECKVIISEFDVWIKNELIYNERKTAYTPNK